MAKPRDESGLTLQEEQFCQLIVRGLSQRQAYRQAFNNLKSADQRIDERASKLKAKLPVGARLLAILKAAKLSDLDSPGAAVADMLADLSRARAADNWTAVMAGHRIRYASHGLMRDNLTITAEQLLDDADLAKRLSKGDPAREAALRAALGGPGFGEEPKQTIQ